MVVVIVVPGCFTKSQMCLKPCLSLCPLLLFDVVVVVILMLLLLLLLFCCYCCLLLLFSACLKKSEMCLKTLSFSVSFTVI